MKKSTQNAHTTQVDSNSRDAPLGIPPPLVLPRALDIPGKLLRRHIGLPPGEVFDEKVQSLIDKARLSYNRHAVPWAASCEVRIADIQGEKIRFIEGEEWTSALVAHGLSAANADAVIVFGASVGGKIDDVVTTHWSEGRPDEAMFLSAFSIAYLEQMRAVAFTQLGAWANKRGRTLLPRYGPGYDGWDLADQASLFRLISHTPQFQEHTLPPITLLESIGLYPTNSTLTMFGLAKSTDVCKPIDNFWKRAVTETVADEPESDTSRAISPACYAFPEKALTKWAAKRLTIDALDDDRLNATFQFDGSSCTNMGIPHSFDMTIKVVGCCDSGYRIESCRCKPVLGDRGHRATCAYLDRPDSFLNDITEFRDMVGKRLDDVLQWSPEVNHAGCLCMESNRNHKWLMALQTLHYALYQTESKSR